MACQPAQPACGDGKDNDRDGVVDANDPGCTSSDDTSELGGECDDAIDNDRDGYTDHPFRSDGLRDPGCSSLRDLSELGTAECDDGLDNDGDGRVDHPADLGCASPDDADETDLPACLDLRDNDGDGRRDYLVDPGCSSPLDNDESDPPRPVTQTTWVAPAAPAARARRLPTLTMAAARRYARQRVKRKTRRATAIKVSCRRRTRTSATCKVAYKADRRAAYKGNMVVRYRFRGSRASLVATSRVRRQA
jgi:hypothetical protein